MKRNNSLQVDPTELQRQRDILRSINSRWSADFIAKKDRPPQYCIETYGCQMNERDSEHLSGMLEVAGFVRGDKDKADLILFNTCCVREHAEARVFGNIGALRKKKQSNPELIIGVCGCMMQQEETAKSLFKRYPFVDMVFGTHSLYAFAEALNGALHSDRAYDVRQEDGRIVEDIPTKRENGIKAFVTIMYGCDNFCTYCIVPYVRGRERSRSVERIEAEVKMLLDDGVKEITLLGQNVNSYGNDTGGTNFASLLRNIDSFADGARLRFMTSHPKDLSDELIRTFAECEHVCKHIHLPIQSGSDDVLKRMNRRYTSADYLGLVKKLRDAVPGIEITTDIIVGFPGETRSDFEDTLRVAREAGFSAAYTFMYSPRTGTAAADMDGQIDEDDKKARLSELNELLAKICAENNKKYIGTTQKVLVEGCEAHAYGKTDGFKTIIFDGESDIVGTYVDVYVERLLNNSLRGRRV